MNIIRKPGAYMQNLQKGLDRGLIWKTLGSSLQNHGIFWIIWNYFHVGKCISRVHALMDLGNSGRSTKATDWVYTPSLGI
jgi:hypothetical protein